MTVTEHQTPSGGLCNCSDPQLELLRDLVTAGMDQREASAIAFNGHPTDNAGPAVWKVWCRLEAHRLAQDVRRRLGLPLTHRVLGRVSR